jgi:hypothetical protein
MAKIAKSKDQANWRKGKDLQVGDLIATKFDGQEPIELSPITAYEGTAPYMGSTNHVWRLANGDTKLVGGGEFARGRYTI